MNIWHDIEASKVKPNAFVAIVEIPYGSKNKYELDKKTGLLRLDRVLFTSTHYPANYGFIPLTYANDGDPLDVLILSQVKLHPMIMVDCHPIGVIRMIDQDEVDDKIIAVPDHDPNYSQYRDISEVPSHVASEIIHFFEVYKNLEHKSTTTSEAMGVDVAKQIILESIERYQVHFRGKCSEAEKAEMKKQAGL
ncbi:inorganic diphosphatase [Amygdalobacter nucleatus]|uniref:Inorganic pyrophosphatase n=1 Tax=Amygdalobacter nucleatus TaxID=3029274 RepID=A0A133YHL7_9FIRM|nr:inorganic diphosphatase [Amygdalobacter nucleatus]KXB42692.1 inorganic diphosphatase [Amygdalobacter nucleatus]MDF0486243.1 inorganic diphosphatase [Amygdalobacter nucleatus]WEG37199.1 inorganic diphosphatase [Amygdalobacter nucleatus]